MRFKQRVSTEYIHVDLKNLRGASAEKLFRMARRCGEFDTGYHLILSNTGLFETDREEGAVAQHDFPDYDSSLYILADVDKYEKLNDAQNAALRRIYNKYPEAEVIISKAV